ncbi:hypothetical protein L208DRAFT_1387074 [Tricholoma matsutake]|nr:hypothetical protein L208DRAFT_1387074 [Tricholoma matsutake 945]
MSGTPVAKGRRRRLLRKLFGFNNPDSPKPPLKQAYQGGNGNTVPGFDLVQAFDALELSGGRNQSDSNFVGGFHPRYRGSTEMTTQPYAASSNIPRFKLPLPVPPSMPIPEIPKNGQQSLTMQMALRPAKEEINFLDQNLLPSRPHTVSPAPVAVSVSVPRPVPSRVHTMPVKPERPRAASSPPTSSDSSISEQCAGITKANKRCSRRVKLGPSLSHLYDNGDGDSPPIERFCFQHTNELLQPSGFFSRKTRDWINFHDWIPDYLRRETQAALRVEMEKPRSQSDVHGYIYTFEIRDSDVAQTIKLKVGRAVNLVKRIDQWGKQCSSKEQIIRGWYPGTVEADADEKSLMKGRIKAGVKVAWCHRLERLIHLELADLVVTGAYLDPGWADGNMTISISKTTTIGRIRRTPCTDCGKVHKEIFEFQRVERGRLVGKEWDMVVKPVIEKWGRFVANLVS